MCQSTLQMQVGKVQGKKEKRKDVRTKGWEMKICFPST